MHTLFFLIVWKNYFKIIFPNFRPILQSRCVVVVVVLVVDVEVEVDVEVVVGCVEEVVEGEEVVAK